jgi:hypothetical protein
MWDPKRRLQISGSRRWLSSLFTSHQTQEVREEKSWLRSSVDSSFFKSKTDGHGMGGLGAREQFLERQNFFLRRNKKRIVGSLGSEQLLGWPKLRLAPEF